jgi:dTDP-4-amino-4,6-dideoxygalactose transaminase
MSLESVSRSMRLTFVATAEAVVSCGATPVFVEVNARTYCLDPDHAATLVTPRTRAIIPVHLYGQAADMSGIAALAEQQRLTVIEDCAQAHGATHHGQKVGTWGRMAGFSFFPGKNIGAFGDAGAVLTKDAATADRIRMLANHGRTDKYLHQIVGVNSRLDGLQGAVLQVKLRHIDKIIAGRRRVAAAYRSNLANLSDRITFPHEDPNGTHVYHLFVIQVAERDKLLKHLNSHGIQAGVHYPWACHEQPAFKNADVTLPVTERLTKRILSLPIFPEMTEEEIGYVCEKVREFFAFAG